MNNFTDLDNKTISGFKKKWRDYQEKYTEKMILSKKMPVYFDFYDYSKDFDNVYEPAEDTFLMIDCLSLEKSEILENLKNKIQTVNDDNNFKFNSTEIGCGSGLVSCCFVSMVFNENQTNQIEMNVELTPEKFQHYCVDVNKDCLNLSKNLFKNYKFNPYAKFVESNLFQYFKENEIKLDLIIFNPPYVTTDDDEFEHAKTKKDISASWAGGKTGSEVTYEFINQLEVSYFIEFILKYFLI
jgi:methylase of polypeptide subunit release factors